MVKEDTGKLLLDAERQNPTTEWAGTARRGTASDVPVMEGQRTALA